MTYKVFSGTLSLTQSVNQSTTVNLKYVFTVYYKQWILL